MDKLTHTAKLYVSKKLWRDKSLLQKVETVRKWTGGILFVTSLFVTALIGFIVLVPICLLCFVLRLQCAQYIYDTLTSTWFAFSVAAYQVFYGVRIVIQGDVTKLNKNRCSLIVMNHRTRLDWLFYFAVQARYASLRRFKIVLKNEIRHLPGAGWAMQGASFIFLKRKWTVDRNRIIKNLEYFKSCGVRPQLLLFPEGTDFQPFSRQRSREYAEKNNLEDYEYVLHPRTLGFTSMVCYMKQYNGLEQIVDVTVSYPENMLQSETDLVTGNIPRVIVFTVQCYDLEDIPSDNDALLAHWVEDRWRQKEAFLKEFYKFKDYSGNNGYSVDENRDIERDTMMYLIGAFIFWSGLVGITWYGMYTYQYFRWFMTSSVSLWVVVSTLAGFENLFPAISGH